MIVYGSGGDSYDIVFPTVELIPTALSPELIYVAISCVCDIWINAKYFLCLVKLTATVELIAFLKPYQRVINSILLIS